MELLKGLSARGRRLLLGVLVTGFGLLASACGGDVGPQDYLSPEGPIAERADGLWDITFTAEPFTQPFTRQHSWGRTPDVIYIPGRPMELLKGLSARGRRLLLGVLVTGFGLLASGCGGDVGPQDFLSPEGPIAERADGLWDITFAIAVIIFVIVEGILVFTLVKFRRRPGREAAQFHGNTKVEVILTLVPTLILAGLAVPTIKAIADLSEKREDSLEIRVVAKQFWWEYTYTDEDVVTANEMHVPTGQPVFLTLEGTDVIHSFWVPKLTGTQDAVPGRVNDMQFIAEKPGTYWGQCKEFCGLSHANMRLRVIVHEPAEFEQWLEDQKEPAAASVSGAAADGEEIFMQTCVNCHAIEGTDAKGTSGPNLTHFASRETFAGAMFDNNAANLRRWIDNPEAVKPGALMPDYGLSAEEIDAVVAYLKTLE